MKKLVFFITICLFINFLSCVPLACAEDNPAPDFQLSDIKNNVVSLSSYRNKQPVLLLFWTTWCPYCRKELRLLNQLYPQLEKDGLEVLAIDIGEAKYKVENFIASYGLVFKVLLDKDNSVAESYELMGVPTYVLINKKQEVVFQANSFPQDEYKELIK